MILRSPLFICDPIVVLKRATHFVAHFDVQNEALSGSQWRNKIGLFVRSQEGGGGLVSAWLVLTSLLKRAHNLPLTLLHLWQYALLRPTLRRRLNADAGAGFAWGLAHHWLAAAWYFQVAYFGTLVFMAQSRNETQQNQI